MRRKIGAAALAVLLATPAAADTITGKQIAAGLSDRKTELAQEAWWDEHMKDRIHEISGRVSEVEEGSFSGYWVTLDIGRNVRVRCGLGDEHKATVAALGKGSRFTCNGRVGNTWTALFGLSFIMEAEEEAARNRSLLDQILN